MNTKHCGYALTEMLVIIAVIVVLMALSVRPLHTLLSEIPRSAGDCQSLNNTTSALKQIKQDIERSTQIIGLDNGSLILEQPEGAVTYTLTAGHITRRPGLHEKEAAYVWQLPDIIIEADLWEQDSKPYAVELITFNQQEVLGRRQKHFKQSTVFFQKGAQQ